MVLCSYNVGKTWSIFICYPAFPYTLPKHIPIHVPYPTYAYAYTCTLPYLHSFYTVFDLSETSAKLACSSWFSVPTTLERLGPFSSVTLPFIVPYPHLNLYIYLYPTLPYPTLPLPNVRTTWSHFVCYTSFNSTLYPTFAYTYTSETSAQLTCSPCAALCSCNVGNTWSQCTCYPALNSTRYPTYTYTYTCTLPNIRSSYTDFNLSETSAQLAYSSRLSVPTTLETLGPSAHVTPP